MEDDWPGDTYSIHLDYVILKFVDVHHDRLKHRLATTFTEEWDEHLEQRLVGIELKKIPRNRENKISNIGCINTFIGYDA